MAKTKLRAQPPALPDLIPVRPISSRLPRERRNLARRKGLERRIRARYEEQPTLCLTLAQATRLFNIPCDAASARILHEFIEKGWLRVNDTGRYVRRAGEPGRMLYSRRSSHATGRVDKALVS
jgi:hypothetical protein